jgi:poly(3-hydroxybutyrate) depolymerase
VAVVGVFATVAVTSRPPPPPPPPPPPQPPAKRAAPLLRGTTVVDAAADTTDMSETLAGCDAQQPEIGTVFTEHLHGLTPVHWWRYVPESYDPRVRHPVVVVLPPKHMNGGEFQHLSGFEGVAESGGFVLITLSSETRYNAAAVEAALRLEGERLCINRRRLFVVGQESGGHDVVRITCDIDIAAIAVGSSRPSRENFDCGADTPVPMILLAPLRSPREQVDGVSKCGGKRKMSLADHEATWVRRNRCAGEPKVERTHAGSTCFAWDCKGASFRSCHLDGGHPWPGTRGAKRVLGDDCDGPPTDFPAAQTLWDFFSGLELDD